MIKINSHTGFQPLLTCLVGQCYPPEFFSFIKNSRIRNIFERIAIETEEDYQKLIKILNWYQVECFRPKLHDDWGMYLYADENGVEKYVKPPMQPRDDMIAIGNKLFVAHLRYGQGSIDPWDWVIDQIDPLQLFDFRNDVDVWQKIAPPCITRVGQDLYFDFASHDINYNKNRYFDLLQTCVIPEHFSDYHIHYVDKGGHSDAVFSPVIPGLLVTYEPEYLYTETFPGWEVVRVNRRELESNDIALNALKSTNGAWWIPGYEFDHDLEKFVANNFKGWVGYSIETYFDVNLLMINEKTAIINSSNEKIISALDSRGIKAHECAFRHRYFWDCGLHCATLDLFRQGERLDYFIKD
jgi:hypothetical protein